MNQSESSDQPSYRRGQYRSASKRTDCDKDCDALRDSLLNYRANIRSQFTLSHNRSKILENLQGLIDYLTKQVKKKEKKEQDPLKRIEELENKVEQLTRIIEFKESSPLDIETLSDLDFNNFPEVPRS